MQHTSKKLDNSQVELTITVSAEEYQPQMEKAATRLAERIAIKGFRKGKAPYDIVKKEAGEMAILQEAMEAIVQKSFFDVITEEKLDTIGMPKIEVEKAAPGNELVYKATVALLPEVKLPSLDKLKVDKIEGKVSDKQLDETLDALRGMHANEVKKDGAAEGTDKLVLDMDMTIDKVPVEGGQSKDYQVYLSENHYIPGFNDQVAGLKSGEEKTFTLDFPAEHYQKHLAGKKVDFKVMVKDVFERQLPEIDDEFAKKLGQESADKLKELIRGNMEQEAGQKAAQQTEIAILDALVEKTKFTDIPEVLIDNERQKMFHELMRDLEKHGVTPQQYLADIKKTEQELYDGFKEQAEKRAKAALISRQVAKEHNIEVPAEDLKAEIEMLKGMYQDNEEAQTNLQRPEVQDTIAVSMQNRKVMGFLHERLFGEEKKEEKAEA